MTTRAAQVPRRAGAAAADSVSPAVTDVQNEQTAPAQYTRRRVQARSRQDILLEASRGTRATQEMHPPGRAKTRGRKISRELPPGPTCASSRPSAAEEHSGCGARLLPRAGGPRPRKEHRRRGQPVLAWRARILHLLRRDAPEACGSCESLSSTSDLMTGTTDAAFKQRRI